jgi:hypothetical protein
MKFLLLLVIVCQMAVIAQAQDSVQTTQPVKPYSTAVGAQIDRGGYLFGPILGITAKHYLNAQVALELNLNGSSGDHILAGSNLLVQKHFQPFVTPGLRWYAGAGYNLDLYRYRVTAPDVPGPVEHRNTITPTIISNLGLEYKMPAAPITFSGDIKPGLLSLGGKGDYRYSQRNSLFNPHLSVRYAF